MNKAKLTFSNGEILILNDEQLVIPIVKYVKDNKNSVSKDKPFQIWYHTNDGLIPSIAELLVTSEFFHLLDNENKIYKSSSVVTVENI